MKEIKYLLTFFWGASLVAAWFVTHILVAIAGELVLWSIPIVATIATAICAFAYCFNNWYK